MTKALPGVDFFGHKVSRLILGGNPLSGISHVSPEMDRDMLEYYTMPNLQKLLGECQRQGVNTVQSRADRHQMRMYMEHRLGGGKLNWIAQTASEFSDIGANVDRAADFGPIAIYNHGTHTDNSWHEGKIDSVLAILERIKSHGLPAGVGTHIPEVVSFMEHEGWPVDFYMCCFYNLARGYKSAPAVQRDSYARERYQAEDPKSMTAVMRATKKPCLGFKIMAASRNCADDAAVRAAFRYAFENIKPGDAVVVGMFQKYINQVERNARLVRELA